MNRSNETQKEFIAIADAEKFEDAYQVDKVIKTTSLYTVKLVSEKNTSDFCREVLLLEHLPATEPRAYLWVHKVNSKATQLEVMRKVNIAVENWFADKK